MKRKFSNADHLQCVFTDDGISLYSRQQLIYFPYGALESIKLNRFGILQIPHKDILCAFEVEEKDRKVMEDLVTEARQKMKTADKSPMELIDLKHKDPSLTVSVDLDDQEQFRRYRIQFLQGLISPEEYHARKIQFR